jgi:hypothetical protein
MEEQKLYRDYLRAQYEEEKRREKELDRIMDEEVEKQFQKRLNQWKAEKQARKDNLARVLRERKMQIEEKSNSIYLLLYYILVLKTIYDQN